MWTRFYFAFNTHIFSRKQVAETGIQASSMYDFYEDELQTGKILAFAGA
jgi:hypothetical protein